jgi:Uma2 family endonuclease
MTTSDYLNGEETMRRRELIYGVLREPPGPLYGHQSVVTQLTAMLHQHVRAQQFGVVLVSPIDVILDEAAHLVVQPDIVVLSFARQDRIRRQIWGAPDLVVEVESAGSRRYDRVRKLDWYRRYGVGEYWLLDPAVSTVTLIAFSAAGDQRRTFRHSDRLESVVLPEFRPTAGELFL